MWLCDSLFDFFHNNLCLFDFSLFILLQSRLLGRVLSLRVEGEFVDNVHPVLTELDSKETRWQPLSAQAMWIYIQECYLALAVFDTSVEADTTSVLPIVEPKIR
jgi:hypothetical protein